MRVLTPANAPADVQSVRLADEARIRPLVVCVGAGISRSELPDQLPDGRRLSQDLDARFRTRLDAYVSPADPANLLDVADAAALLIGGEELLRNEVLKVAEFTRARPNEAHRMVSMLICEGAITVLSWNWDTCIERARPEQPQRARTAAEMESMQSPLLVKVHGCAAVPDSLLVTSEHLSDPPDWTANTFRNHTLDSTTVFVGIGDVADYAQKRLQEVVARVQQKPVYVVSPSIKRKWGKSKWSETLPGLPEDRRVGKDAETFFDDFTRAWLSELFESVLQRARGYDEDRRNATSRVLDAFGAKSAPAVVEWLRGVTMKIVPGESAVLDSGTAAAFLALGRLAEVQDAAVEMLAPTSCRIGQDHIEVLFLRDVPTASDVQYEMDGRIGALVGREGPRHTVRFLLSGVVDGPLKNRIASQDIFHGGGDPVDLIDGPSSTTVEVTTVADVLAADA